MHADDQTTATTGVTLVETDDGRVLEIEIAGKLDRSDYDVFVPRVEQLIERHGKIRMLVTLNDFHGWTAGALWDDVKFDARHFNDIERLAIVGEKKWEQAMAAFCKPFTTATVRYFDAADVATARHWLHEGIQQQGGAL